MKSRFAALALLPITLLVACGDGDGGENDNRTADGEILPGTISDAMIPLDQLRSEGQPMADKSGKPTGAQGPQSDAPAATPAAEEPAPAQEAEPSAPESDAQE